MDGWDWTNGWVIPLRLLRLLEHLGAKNHEKLTEGRGINPHGQHDRKVVVFLPLP